MIDLTFSSDDETPRKRQRVFQSQQQQQQQLPPQQHPQQQQQQLHQPAVGVLPTGPRQPTAPAGAAAQPAPANASQRPNPSQERPAAKPGSAAAATAAVPAAASQHEDPFPDPDPDPDPYIDDGQVPNLDPGDDDYEPSHDGEDEALDPDLDSADDADLWDDDERGRTARRRGGGRGAGRPAGGGRARAAAGGRRKRSGSRGSRGGADEDEFDDDDRRAGVGGAGAGRRGGAAAAAAAAGGSDDDAELEDAALGGGSQGGAAAARRRGGGGKRLTAEEKEEREAARAAEKAARAAERERAWQEKAAAKAAEKERKAAEKEEAKRAKAAQKDAAKATKEAGNSLKASMVIRHMRMLLSNSLAASPLGARMVELAPVARGAGAKDQNFDTEVHRDMPLAAKGYRYCMWGVRLPAAAAARVAAAEGAALEPSQLGDPEGTGLPLLLFPAALVVLSGDELLSRLDAEPGAPLCGLVGDVRRAHPGATLLVYVVGLDEALRRRERGNKSFSRAAVEDQLLDLVVGMPALRLQYDCPEAQLERAAHEILNLGWALSQQPRKRTEAYLETFGSKSTVPLRAVKEVLSRDGGPEQLTLCDALSCLVAPQRAAAVAAELPSLAALLEALRSRPDATRAAMARYRIPGVVPGKYKQQYAGPAAAASIARFLTIQNGREEWKDAAE